MPVLTADYLTPCPAPGCGQVRRWWAGPYCPAHTTPPEETPMTCRWCEKPMPAAHDKPYCNLHCHQAHRWYGVTPDAHVATARAERERRQVRESADDLVGAEPETAA